MKILAHANTLIADREIRPRDMYLNRRSFWRVFEGVGEDIADHMGEEIRITLERKRTLSEKDDLVGRSTSEEGIDDRVYRHDGIDCRWFEVSRTDMRECEHVINITTHRVDFAFCLPEIFVLPRFEAQIDRSGYIGKRRFELMARMEIKGFESSLHLTNRFKIFLDDETSGEIDNQKYRNHFEDHGQDNMRLKKTIETQKYRDLYQEKSESVGSDRESNTVYGFLKHSLGTKNIPLGWNCIDEFFVELFSKLGYMDIDRSGKHEIIALSPDIFYNLYMRNDFSLFGDEIREQIILTRREMNETLLVYYFARMHPYN